MKHLPTHRHRRLMPFTFACKLNGVYVATTLLWADNEFMVQINGFHAANLQLAEDGYSWIVSEGILNDDVFIQEITDWIEAR